MRRKKVRLMKVHEDTYRRLKVKKMNIERTLSNISGGKKKKVYMTDMMNLLSYKPIYIEDFEIKDYFMTSKRKRKNRGGFLV
jgi:hypothetical protein